jgi:Cd2+/Zn2+-exporting ATPase
MAAADCAVSMGSLGSAAAVEASDFVLISDELSAIPHLIKTAQKTRKIVLQNVVFSIVMKSAFLLVGLFPWFALWMGVFADVGVMLIAVLNSLRVRR